MPTHEGRAYDLRAGASTSTSLGIDQPFPAPQYSPDPSACPAAQLEPPASSTARTPVLTPSQYAAALQTLRDDDIASVKPVEPATWLVITHSELPIVAHKRFKNSLTLAAFKEKLERILGTNPVNMEVHFFDRASKAEAVWTDEKRNLGSFALADYSIANVLDLQPSLFADSVRLAHGGPQSGGPLPAAGYERTAAQAVPRSSDVWEAGNGVLLVSTEGMRRRPRGAELRASGAASPRSSGEYRLPHDDAVHRGTSPLPRGQGPSPRAAARWPAERVELVWSPHGGEREAWDPRREAEGPFGRRSPPKAWAEPEPALPLRASAPEPALPRMLQPPPPRRGPRTEAWGGQVVAWGAGKHHQLGVGDEEDRLFPALVALSAEEGPLRAAVCGWNHSAAIAGDGALLTWGSGKYGRIGHETNLKQPVPRAVEALAGIPVRQVAFGWSHTLVLSEDGAVYAMGYGAFGQLGLGDERRASLPRRVEGFGEPVALVACGGYHSAAVTRAGRLYCWGSGPLGCTGRGRDARDSSAPSLVALPAADGEPAVASVACGGFHTAVATARGDLYTFGWGAYGQLGHGALEGEAVPRRVAALDGVPVRAVACGGFHTLALADDGRLLAFGRGSEGQLGAGDLLSRAAPALVRVPLRAGDAVTSVSAGLRHSAVVTEGGRLYTFGSNSRGQLGHPAWPAAPLCEPRQVGVLHGLPVLSASCGWDHTLALLAGRSFDESTAEERAATLLAASAPAGPAPAAGRPRTPPTAANPRSPLLFSGPRTPVPAAASPPPPPAPGPRSAPAPAPAPGAPRGTSPTPLRAAGGLALPFGPADTAAAAPDRKEAARASSPGPAGGGGRPASPAMADVMQRAAAMAAIEATWDDYLPQPGVGYAAGPPAARGKRQPGACADELPAAPADTRGGREVTVARFTNAREEEPERARAALRAAIARVEARRASPEKPAPPGLLYRGHAHARGPPPPAARPPAARREAPAPRAPSPAAGRAGAPLRRANSAPVPHSHGQGHAPTQPPGGPGYEAFEHDSWAASLRTSAPAVPRRSGQRRAARAAAGSEGHEYALQLRDALEGAVVTEAPRVRWSEVIGLRDAKQALFEAALLPLRFPHLFTGNRKPCSRILLYGPPGTGKTLLARAAASALEGGTFFSVSSADLLSRWYGESEKLVRALFAMARERRPAVIFLDDADALFRTRQEAEHEASRRLKNEFLVQIQGLGSDNEGVVLLAATNIPWQLDSAFRRRFERSIYVPLPDRAARARMLQLQVGETPCALDEADFLRLADRCAGYSGSDLECVAREALMEPVRDLLAATHFKPVELPTPEGLRRVAVPCPPTDPAALRVSLLELQRGHVVPPRMATFDDFVAALERCPRTVTPAEVARFEKYHRQLAEPAAASPAEHAVL